jgi:Subtilase family/Peptidase inhibitor I9
VGGQASFGRIEVRRSFSARAALAAALSAALVALAMSTGAGASMPGALGWHFHLGAKPRHAALSTARVRAGTRRVSQRVIVVLRNQHRAHPASIASVRARERAETKDRAPLLRRIRRAGGSVTRQYRALNAFAATVSSAEHATLAHDPAVAQVVADEVVRLPKPDAATGFPSSSATLPAPNVNPVSGICPTDPSKPLLEPEALQTTHTAFTDPSTPQAQSLSTGKGVRIAFFADGLDINNPDLIRADGSHVIVDYKDFSGDGPDAPTGAAEAFGDASSIAAQGRQSYDIADYVNQAHPLPAGCTINVRGMAPDASLIAMKVFGEASVAFNSVILQGLDYAVAVDHADILSESFGGTPVPDSTNDLTRRFNEQAVAAGVTVVESTGDSGAHASVESAASDPAVVAAGASTNFRGYAQTASYAFQFAGTGWVSDNISSIGTSGVDQGGHNLDLVAPGEVGWALCSPDIAIYEECLDFRSPTRGGSGLQQFGGTSESAPLIAGAAALVLQAYRETHGGATPAPALVKQLLTSTSDDLGLPSVEEGSGELDSLKAVQAARAINGGTPEGHALVIGPTQLDLAGPAGSDPGDQPVDVTNTGATTQTVTAQGRTIAGALGDVTQTVNLGPASPTFVDQFGSARPYARSTFTVPAGTDRLVADDAWPGPEARVGLALIDPNGNYAAYTRPQGNGDHGEVDVEQPPAGTWTAITFIRDGTFAGPVHLEFLSQRYGQTDTVTPASLTLAPGEKGAFHYHTALSASPGDVTHDLVVGDSSGDQTVVPVVLRSLVNLDPTRGGTFDGTILGGNGRVTSRGQLDTFAFDVPAGEPELAVGLTFADDQGTELTGTLVDPSGEARSLTSTTHLSADGTTATEEHALQAYRVDPEPGRWHFVVNVLSPVGGTVLQAPYHGAISFRPPTVTTNKVPNSALQLVKAAKPRTATIDVTNDGVAPEDVFVDPRRPDDTVAQLAPLTPPTIKIPLAPTDAPPFFQMPTQSSVTAAFTQATEPITFDFGFNDGDPDVPAMSSGNTASAQFAATELPQGAWFMAPDPVGPFDGPAPAGTATSAMLAQTRAFDGDAVASTGDIWREAVGLRDGTGFAPITIKPGHHQKITVTFAPTAPKGTVVEGTLFVDDFSFEEFFGDELLAIPYRYQVG